ncbi:YsnF/AvaK domain-containing protein [Pontibacter sp. BT731]|uniref:YsnF/AvaK domain-containing protein n=1 Tax=Pontibacter coccineus TaxID=3063328 RepID=UPI0026E2339A|nr:YsnF/AvaK domain-containing protein [Pontibacter sp. BT731]MDO6391190.1 YsnF/AvaK domain-containing protein [Pontibacter sp. BT731]
MSKKTDKLKSEFDEKLREGYTNYPPDDRDMQDAHGREKLDVDIAYNKTIPVIEEQVLVEKEVRETGSVHIAKEVHRENVDLDLPIIHEEAEIERVEINQYVDTPPPPVRYEGDKMIIPVLKEVLVVEKRLLVVEEIHVTRRRTEEHNTEHIELLREEIRVERKRNNPDRPER